MSSATLQLISATDRDIWRAETRRGTAVVKTSRRKATGEMTNEEKNPLRSPILPRLFLALPAQSSSMGNQSPQSLD